MEVTDVQVKIVPRANNKLKAFCTVTFDNCFVIKDVRIIQGQNGMIVAMPAKKLTFRCNNCGFKNPLGARFCCDCGRRVRGDLSRRNPQTGRPIMQVDVAHPINPETRGMIEKKVIEAYEREFNKYKESLQAATQGAFGGPLPPPPPPEPPASQGTPAPVVEAAPAAPTAPPAEPPATPQ